MKVKKKDLQENFVGEKKSCGENKNFPLDESV
jgi:hypothetical protein